MNNCLRLIYKTIAQACAIGSYSAGKCEHAIKGVTLMKDDNDLLFVDHDDNQEISQCVVSCYGNVTKGCDAKKQNS